jgi:hypothetical protein
MVAKFRNTIYPSIAVFTSIEGLRCLPIQKEHDLYIAESTRKAVYNVRCLWYRLCVQGIAGLKTLADDTADLCQV